MNSSTITPAYEYLTRIDYIPICTYIYICIYIYILLQQPRETLKWETSKQGIWPINKQELITRHLKQFMKFTNSIDFDKL